MINRTLGQWLAVPWVALLLLTSANANEDAFRGVFKGQGRGCWGKLFLKEKTLQWTTPYSVCKSTQYKVLERELTVSNRHIAFELARRSAQCRYAVIELSFDSQTPDYWLAKGYASLDDFNQRQSASDASKLRTLSCAVQKQD